MESLARTGPMASTPVRRQSEPQSAERDPARNSPTIVHLTAEFYPYARTGGLAEAVAGLAAFQVRAGNRVVVFMPLYSVVREVMPDLQPLGPTRAIPFGRGEVEVRFFRPSPAPAGPDVIFVDIPAYFRRHGLYGERGVDYPDNHLRFASFCLAALNEISRIVPEPMLLHVHDWHAALAPVYMRTYDTLRARFRDVPVVVSVHNAGYQGHFPESAMEELGLPWELWTPDRLEWYGRVNLLKGALTCCDVAVTVSPTHAVELCTPEGGFGLHDTFRALGNRLVGICNGIDQRAWNPATDRRSVASYSAADLTGKSACKLALQRAFGLPERHDVPLFGMACRLVQQKGFDIVLASERVRSFDAQFVFLGEGEPHYRDALKSLAMRRPANVAVEFAFTDALEHRFMSGADVVLMPSLYEPCGLTQMRALRYGAPVVARSVGGIRDTIEDGVTGFLFDSFDAPALDGAIDRALACFGRRRKWTTMMRNGMRSDFGWTRPATAYAAAYATASRLAAVAA